MLNKLLKYDLKWIYKLVIIFYILAIIFSIIARIMSLFDNSMLFTVLKEVTSGFAIGMLVSSLINTLMRSWGRFVINVYKDESYLTHTLPVNKKDIYLAKVIASIIVSFSTILVTLLCIYICYYSKDNMALFKHYLELTANAYNITIINLILITALVFFLELIFILLCGYVGIIIGHKSNNKKMIKSVIYSFCFYLFTSALTLGIVYVIGLFNKDIMNLINTTKIINIDAIKGVMLAGIVIYMIYDLIYYFIGIKEFNKGVNVD